jgi:toxin ParE1/3/4
VVGQQARFDCSGDPGIGVVSRWIVRQRADRDIDEQLVYLARRSHSLAARFLESLEQTFVILTESPDRGFCWDDDSRSERSIRVCSVRGFPNVLVFYRPIENGVEIIRVLHGARDISTILDSDSE